ncbi:MAG: helix-turn-helix domain-containing protein [Alphaproteobacteria bacterium]|nr:helix-turn-helix domain-containing protein [Alphaproteobacteria bacterium]
MISGRQIRAARALLDMSQEALAKSAGLTPQAIRKIEDGSVQPREGTIADIMRAFNNQGVEFTDNNGVRFKPQNIEVLENRDGFSRFYEILFEHLSEHGGDVCVSGVNERLFAKYRTNAEVHREKMAELVKNRSDLTMRILIEDGDQNYTAASYAQYRWQQKEYFSPTSFYVFGDHLGLISFSHDPAPLVVLIKSSPFAEAYRQSFNFAWSNAKEAENVGRRVVR